MREHSRDKERLEHILDAISVIENGLATFAKDELLNNKLLYYGLVKQIEIIGEAANMLTHEFRAEHAEVDWRPIIAMRNVLVHGYAQISDADLWQTATADIQPLRQQIERYLAEIDWEQWQQEQDPYTEIDSIAYKQAADSARKMKAKGYPIIDIAEITGLSEEEIKNL